MSYKTNSAGGIALESFDTQFNLTDSADISGTFTNNQTLNYDTSSGGWTSADMPSGDLGTAGYSFYATSGATWRTGSSAGGSLYDYIADYTPNSDTPPRELMQNAYASHGVVINLPTGHTQYNWGLYNTWYNGNYPRLSGVFVPSGTWKCKATIPGTPYDSGAYAVVRWCTGPSVGTSPTTANLTQVGPHFYHAIDRGRFCHIPSYIITTTASTTLLGLEFVEGSNYQYGFNANWTKYCSFHVTKIG